MVCGGLGYKTGNWIFVVLDRYRKPIIERLLVEMLGILWASGGSININVPVVQKPLVPLIRRLVACSERNHVDRQTDQVP